MTTSVPGQPAAPLDPRVPAVLHSVARKMRAKADAALEEAKNSHRIACEVIERTEAAARRADALVAEPDEKAPAADDSAGAESAYTEHRPGSALADQSTSLTDGKGRCIYCRRADFHAPDCGVISGASDV